MRKSNTKTNTKFMVELALMSAIIFVMAFTPLGYFRTPALSITFLPVPVAVGAILLGVKGGAVCGLVFGITSLIQCFGFSAFTTMLMSINPVGTIILCIVPRVLEGVLCALVFQAAKKWKNGRYFLASFACPFFNTLFYMSFLVLIFYRTEYIQSYVSKFGVSNPIFFIFAFVGIQGLIEAIVCTFIGTMISRTLGKVLKTV